MWSACLQLFWCGKAVVYSSFGIKIRLFELKKPSSNQIVSPFWGKSIGVHHKVARAPSTKRFTSTKLAFYHFLNMIGAHVWFPRAPAHVPLWCAPTDTTIEDAFCVCLQFRQESKYLKCLFQIIAFSKSDQTSSKYKN